MVSSKVLPFSLDLVALLSFPVCRLAMLLLCGIASFKLTSFPLLKGGQTPLSISARVSSINLVASVDNLLATVAASKALAQMRGRDTPDLPVRDAVWVIDIYFFIWLHFCYVELTIFLAALLVVIVSNFQKIVGART